MSDDVQLKPACFVETLTLLRVCGGECAIFTIHLHLQEMNGHPGLTGLILMDTISVCFFNLIFLGLPKTKCAANLFKHWLVAFYLISVLFTPLILVPLLGLIIIY